jgi:hypothetical protein
MQVLFTLPEMTQCYSQNRFFERGDLAHPDADLGLQLGKLCRGLLSGDYSMGPDRQGWKKPGFKKKPAQCFFFGFLGFFWFFKIYICPGERVFRVFSVSRILLGASRL